MRHLKNMPTRINTKHEAEKWGNVVQNCWKPTTPQTRRQEMKWGGCFFVKKVNNGGLKVENKGVFVKKVENVGCFL